MNTPEFLYRALARERPEAAGYAKWGDLPLLLIPPLFLLSVRGRWARSIVDRFERDRWERLEAGLRKITGGEVAPGWTAGAGSGITPTGAKREQVPGLARRAS